MDLYYTIIVSDTQPTNYAPGTLWLKKDIGLVLIHYLNEKYIHLSAGSGNLTVTDGVYQKIVALGSTPPAMPDIGQLWLQNSQSYWIWLNGWYPFGGN